MSRADAELYLALLRASPSTLELSIPLHNRHAQVSSRHLDASYDSQYRRLTFLENFLTASSVLVVATLGSVRSKSGTSSMLQRFTISACGHMSSQVPSIAPLATPTPAWACQLSAFSTTNTCSLSSCMAGKGRIPTESAADFISCAIPRLFIAQTVEMVSSRFSVHTVIIHGCHVILCP